MKSCFQRGGDLTGNITSKLAFSAAFLYEEDGDVCSDVSGFSFWASAKQTVLPDSANIDYRRTVVILQGKLDFFSNP